MAVGMSHMHFPHVPRHVRRRPGHLDALPNALFIDGIHVLDPPTHPAALSCVSSSKLAKVLVFFPFPRPPWPPRHIKISHGPEPMAPNPVGSPQRHNSFQPSLANHAKLSSMSETLRIGVTP